MGLIENNQRGMIDVISKRFISGGEAMPFCPSCGNKIQEGIKFCPECGQRLIAQETKAMQEKPKDIRSSTVIIEKAEPTYYSDEKGVRITPSRLIIGSTTYAMANITSIRLTKDYNNRWGGVALAGLGLFAIAIGAPFDIQVLVVSGFILLVAGIACAVLLKPTRHLRVSSASGETDALTSNDEKYIAQIATALNEALIKRG